MKPSRCVLILYIRHNKFHYSPFVSYQVADGEQTEGWKDRKGEIEVKGNIHANFVSNTSKMTGVDLAVGRRPRNAEDRVRSQDLWWTRWRLDKLSSDYFGL